MMMLRYAAVFLFILLFVCGCQKQITTTDHHARQAVGDEQTRPELGFVRLAAADYPAFEDRFDADSFQRAVDFQLKALAKQRGEKSWVVGERNLSRQDLVRTLRRLAVVFQQHHHNSAALRRAIQAEFDVYQVIFDQKPDILFTGYYAPVLDGRLGPDAQHRFPLYAMPDDMLKIQGNLFDDRVMKMGSASRGGRISARLNDKRQVVPYYSREEIDEFGALKGKNLELVYLNDYMAQFLFHVQGGGFVRVENGRYMKLNYAGQNGHKYRSIGKLLVAEGIIPAQELFLDRVLSYLEANPGELKRVCYQNPSYIFYKTDGKLYERLEPHLFPNGSQNFPVTSKRSIATDKSLFPGGMPAYIIGRQDFEGDGQPSVAAFVIDQDTGGAIDDNHIDFFVGAGTQAKQTAGAINDPNGRLYFLVLKATPVSKP